MLRCGGAGEPVPVRGMTDIEEKDEGEGVLLEVA